MHVKSPKRCVFAALTLLSVLASPFAVAQTATISGQLVASDSLQPLSEVPITARTSSRLTNVIHTTTGPTGQFSFSAEAGTWYRLCSGSTGPYADSCLFSSPVEVKAGTSNQFIRLTAPAGIRMRIRIVDANGLLPSAPGAAVNPSPLLLHVFADNGITNTRVPIQLLPSATVENAVEAAVVIPTSANWDIALSSNLAQLFDANGILYQAPSPVPRPATNGSSEFLAVYTLRAK